MKKLSTVRGQIIALAIAVLIFGMNQQALAAEELEALTKMTDFVKAGAILLILLITVAGFIWIGWGTLVKFNDARRGQSEWGEVGLLAVAAVGVLVFLGYLLDKASSLVA